MIQESDLNPESGESSKAIVTDLLGWKLYQAKRRENLWYSQEVQSRLPEDFNEGLFPQAYSFMGRGAERLVERGGGLVQNSKEQFMRTPVFRVGLAVVLGWHAGTMALAQGDGNAAAALKAAWDGFETFRSIVF